MTIDAITTMHSNEALPGQKRLWRNETKQNRKNTPKVKGDASSIPAYLQPNLSKR